MSFGVFKNNPNIKMDHHNNHNHPNRWHGAVQMSSSGPYPETPLDPRLFEHANPSQMVLDGSQNAYEFHHSQQTEQRYFLGSTDQFDTPHGLLPQDRLDGGAYLDIQPPHSHHQFASCQTGLLSPASDFSAHLENNVIKEEEGVSNSTLDRSSPDQSDYASPPFIPGMGLPRQPAGLTGDWDMMGISIGHASLTEHQHHRIDSVVSPDQVMTCSFGEPNILAPQHILEQPDFLLGTGLDTYSDMGEHASHAAQSLALPLQTPTGLQISHPHPHAHHEQEHNHITTHLQVPAPVHSPYMGSPSPSIVDDSPSPTELDPESDLDFNPKKPSSTRGKPTRRAKAQRVRKQSSHSRQRSGDSTRTQQRSRTVRGTRGIGTSTANQNTPASSGTNSLDAKNNETTKIPLKRDYPCLFAPYGCTAAFTAKNEWSRHMRTQHVKSGVFRCPICFENGGGVAADSVVASNSSSRPSTSSASSSSSSPTSTAADSTNGSQTPKKEPGEFKRKDLFTPHLRRMHLHRLWPQLHDLSITSDPLINAARAEINKAELKGAAKSAHVTIKMSPEAEAEVERLVKRAWVEVRRAPESCVCPICPIVETTPSSSSHHESGAEATGPRTTIFNGPSAWDQRMEHIATTHFSRIRRTSISGTAEVPAPETWAGDEALERWLLEEGLAEQDEAGVWKCKGVRGNGREGYCN